MKEAFISEFSKLAASPDRDLATPALMIARLECPSLDPQATPMTKPRVASVMTSPRRNAFIYARG